MIFACCCGSQWQLARDKLYALIQSLDRQRKAADAAATIPSVHAERQVLCPPFLWRVVAGAIARAGEWRALLEFLSYSEQHGMLVNCPLYTQAMAACYHAAQWDEVLRLYEQAAASAANNHSVEMDAAMYALAMHASKQVGDVSRIDTIAQAAVEKGAELLTEPEMLEQLKIILSSPVGYHVTRSEAATDAVEELNQALPECGAQKHWHSMM